MFLRQLNLIVAALTSSLSAICSYLYQVPLLKGVAILGLLWSIYACYKIFSFNFNGVSHSKTSIDKEEPMAPDEEIVSPKEPEIFLRDQGSPHNINKEPNVAIKKEPIISKNLKQSSKI